VIPKPLEDVTLQNIEGLVNAKNIERRTLEYKQLLPTNNDEEKREFLYDISSLANASGGDIIYRFYSRTGAEKIHGT
jgi:hypothetical protein